MERRHLLSISVEGDGRGEGDAPGVYHRPSLPVPLALWWLHRTMREEEVGEILTRISEALPGD
jgi:hypothetical protein